MREYEVFFFDPILIRGFHERYEAPDEESAKKQAQEKRPSCFVTGAVLASRYNEMSYDEIQELIKKRIGKKDGSVSVRR